MPKYGSVIDPPDLDATLPTVDASESGTVETNLMLNSQATLPDEYALDDYLTGLDLELAQDGTGAFSPEESLRLLVEEGQKIKDLRMSFEAKLKEFQK